MRQIAISSTYKPEAVLITSDAITRDDLYLQLGDEFGVLSDMNLMIGETSTTLTLGESILPEEDFTLFIMPKAKTSAGASKRAEIYKEIYYLQDNFGDKAKDHFKGFTNLTSEVLENKIAEFNSVNRKACTDTSEPTCNSKRVSTDNVSAVLEDIKDLKVKEGTHPLFVSGVDSLKGMVGVWLEIFNPYNYNIKERLNQLVDKVRKENDRG